MEYEVNALKVCSSDEKMIHAESLNVNLRLNDECVAEFALANANMLEKRVQGSMLNVLLSWVGDLFLYFFYTFLVHYKNSIRRTAI